jgi:DNA-binding CsgD family transcriptional regulator
LPAPMTWSPEILSYTLGLQALLGLYLRVTDRVWSPIRPLSPDLTVFQGLTARQRSILQLVSLGKSTSSIAARLGFSPATIKQDLRRAMVVLDVSDRQSAVQRAIEFGLIPAP